MKDLFNILINHNEKGNLHAVSVLFTPDKITSINPTFQSKFTLNKKINTPHPFIVPTKILKQALNIINDPYFDYDVENRRLYCKGLNQELSFQVIPAESELLQQYTHEDVYDAGEVIADITPHVQVLDLVKNYASKDTTDTLHAIEIAVYDDKLHIRATDNISLIDVTCPIKSHFQHKIYILPETADLLLKLVKHEPRITINQNGLQVVHEDFQFVELNHKNNFPDIDNYFDTLKLMDKVSTNILPLKQAYEVAKKLKINHFIWHEDEVVVQDDTIKYKQPSLLPKAPQTIYPSIHGLHFTQKIDEDTKINITFANDYTLNLYEFDYHDYHIRIVAVNFKF